MSPVFTDFGAMNLRAHVRTLMLDLIFYNYDSTRDHFNEKHAKDGHFGVFGKHSDFKSPRLSC
jgi:hypothetical protein